MVTVPGVRYYDHDRFEETGELGSLFAAERELARPDPSSSTRDILFEQTVLDKLLRAEADCAIVVDRAWVDQREPPAAARQAARPGDHRPHARGGATRPARRRRRPARSRSASASPPSGATGEFIGLALFSERGTAALREVYQQRLTAGAGPFHEADRPERGAFTDLLQELVERGETVACVDVYKGWLEVDTFEDYQRAWAAIKA